MLAFANADRKKVAKAFKKQQILSAAFVATSQGLDDAQKTMG